MINCQIQFSVPRVHYTTREVPQHVGRRPRARDLISEVAARHGMTAADITYRGPGCLKQRLSRVRQEAMWEIRQRTALSLPQIGRLFGLKDHTTILHGVRAHEKRIAAR